MTRSHAGETIRERAPGVWPVRVGRDRAGKDRVLTRRFGVPPSRPERALKQLVRSAKAGNAGRDRTTVAELMAAHLADLEAKGRQASTVATARTYGRNIVDRLGTVAVAALTARHLDDLYTHLALAYSAGLGGPAPRGGSGRRPVDVRPRP